MASRRHICIHGHFYQPPRENPWLEVVEAQESTAPHHDWNQRVTAECYGPNSAARILGRRRAIANIVNNYERISFNFGPTLLFWLQTEAPWVHEALITADRVSQKRLGAGNALAQIFNHVIMPLATPRDKTTQVRWGVRDFERFGRWPQGMWLAEAAVDLQSLTIIAAEGIEFTILIPQSVPPVSSPSQCAQLRSGPEALWQDVRGGRVDPRRPYQVALPGRGRIAVFFYDGPASRAVAFERLLDSGEALADRVRGLLDPHPAEPQLASLVTDGESYGHHHAFGEMALAYALDLLERDHGLKLTNFGAYLREYPPTWEARIVENSSWSCIHGVERWRSDCGCGNLDIPGWNQAWRVPLHEGLNALKARLDALFERLGRELFADPWTARDQYVDLLHDRSKKARADFLARHQERTFSPAERVRANKLLESQRYGMYMFTSCGWFFDDLAGLEPVQNLRYAARALQLAQDLDGREWESELLAILAGARSNHPEEGNGADIWRRRVAAVGVGPRRVAAHVAISAVLGEDPPPEELYSYRVQTLAYFHRHNLGLHLSWGRLRIAHCLEAMLYLHEVNVPLPRVFTALAEVLLAEEAASRLLEEEEKGVVSPHLGEVALAATSLGLTLNVPRLHEVIKRVLTRGVEEVCAGEGTGPAAQGLARMNQVLDLVGALKVEADLWRAQNRFHRLLKEKGWLGLRPEMLALGQRLNFDLD